MQLPNARPMDAENEKPAGASGDGGVAGDEDDRQVDELDSGDEEEDDEEEDEDEDEEGQLLGCTDTDADADADVDADVSVNA